MEQNLQNVQRWMQSVITHPTGVDAGLVAELTQSHLPLKPSDVERVIEPSSQMTSTERLAIYSGAYFARLIECLEADFPIFRQTVGQEAFAGFAIDYLQRHPSQSYTLGQLGAKFPDYLAATRPEPTETVELSKENGSASIADWPDFLVDLARLERTLSEVFDGPGVEQQAIISADDLSAIEPARWPEMRLTIVPCVRLLSSRFPLNDYYTAMKNSKTSTDGNDHATPLPEMPLAKQSWLAITRRDYIVRRYELTETEFTLLSALAAGHTLGEAIEQAAEFYPGEMEQLTADLRRWFQTWTAAPMFSAAISREQILVNCLTPSAER